MLLVLTRTHDPTVDYVTEKLIQLQIPYQRVNTDQLLRQRYHFSIGSGKKDFWLENASGIVNLNDVTAVWYRRPVSPIISTLIEDSTTRRAMEAESEALLRNIYMLIPNARWVSHPSSIRSANNKLAQLVSAQETGFIIPDTLVTNETSHAKALFEEFQGKLIMKTFTPVIIDSGSEDEKLASYTTRIHQQNCDLLDNIDVCPTILQAEVERDFELRVTVFGHKVFAAKMVTSDFPNKEVDWRLPSVRNQQWLSCDVPTEVASMCVKMVENFGLSYGAFDIAHTPSGNYVFFELNPNGQWVWLEIDTGAAMTDALLQILGCI